MLKYFIALGVLFSLLTNCQKASPPSPKDDDIQRDCSCPIEELKQASDIKESSGTSSTLTTDGRLKIGGPIFSYLTGEVEAGLSFSDKTEHSKIVIDKIRNDFTGHEDKVIGFAVGRLYACAKYTVHCRNSNISDSLLYEKAIEDIELFEQRFFEEPTITEPQTERPKRPSSNPNTDEIKSTFSGVLLDVYSGKGVEGVQLIYNGSSIGKTSEGGNFSFEVEGDFINRKLPVYARKKGYQDSLYYITSRSFEKLKINPQ